MPPDFAYLAVDPKGREKRGRVKASDAGDAKARLATRKLQPVSVTPVGRS